MSRQPFFRPLWDRAAVVSPRLVAASLLGVAVAAGLLLDRAVPPVPQHRLASPPVHRAPPAKRSARAKAVAAKALPAKPSTAKPPPPSAFAREQAMGYGQLLGRWTPLIREASRRFDISAL